MVIIAAEWFFTWVSLSLLLFSKKENAFSDQDTYFIMRGLAQDTGLTGEMMKQIMCRK